MKYFTTWFEVNIQIKFVCSKIPNKYSAKDNEIKNANCHSKK